MRRRGDQYRELRAALADAGVADTAAEAVVSAVRGDAHTAPRLTHAYRQQRAWELASGRITMTEFAASVWQASVIA